MKILHVQSTLTPRVGGPATVLPQLAKAQANAGSEVTIATTNVDQPNGVFREAGWDTLADGAVRVLYASSEFSPLMVSLGLARYLRRSISDFDVVHIHGIYRFPTTLAASLSRQRGIPYVIRPHGSLDPFLYSKSSSSVLFKRIYERLFDLPNLRAASAIHYTAEDERERASFLGLQSASFVVPNGLEWERFDVLPARGELRARWGLGDDPIVLFLGRLHHKKGLDILVPAFESVLHEIPNAQLVLAGPENDDFGQQVRGWVAERKLTASVRFVGELQGDDVVKAYVDSDVFVLPSYTENFGMTVIEAMACGSAVVISDQVNIHDNIKEARAGVVTRCDAAEVSEALLRLLGDEELRSVMGAAGRRFVKSRYTWPAIVEALATEYRSVTGIA